MSYSLPIKTKNIYSGKVIDLSLVTTELPNGKTVELEVIDHPGGAAIVAINSSHQVCLIRQYRYVVDDYIWELPAGKIDAGEDPQVTAKRELLEEAGVTARDWNTLGIYISSPGVFREIVHLYLATHVEQGNQSHEEDEVIEVHWVDLDLARQWALESKINDGKSALALLRAHDIVRKLS